MDETWVKCAKAGPVQLPCYDVRGVLPWRTCNLPGGDEVVPDDCAACPVPVMAAALEALLDYNRIGEVSEEQYVEAGDAALARYRGEKRSEDG